MSNICTSGLYEKDTDRRLLLHYSYHKELISYSSSVITNVCQLWLTLKSGFKTGRSEFPYNVPRRLKKVRQTKRCRLGLVRMRPTLNLDYRDLLLEHVYNISVYKTQFITLPQTV